MKNALIMTIMMIALLVAGCGESQQITAWGLSSPNQDLTARVGVRDGDTEIFVTGKYEAADNVEWDRLTPTDVGAGILFHLTQEGSIEDTPDLAPIIGPLLETLNARPYAGIELVGPLEGEQRRIQYNFIAGTTFTLDSNIGLVVEYIDGDQVETGGVYIGGVFMF